MEEDLSPYQEKLKEFVGESLDLIGDITQRQKEAIEKMVFLNKHQFNDLILDIAEEIDYRIHNIDVKIESESKLKLRQLDDRMLKNLATDALLVMRNKVSYTNQTNNTKKMLNEVEEILSKLKTTKSDEEYLHSKLDKCETQQEKLFYFFDYLEKKFKENNLDPSVVERMKYENDNLNKETVEMNLHLLFNINILFTFFKKYNSLNQEFLFRRSNLAHLLDHKDKVPEKIIYKEITELFHFILQDKQKNYKESKEIVKSDASLLMRSLENFVYAIKSNASQEEVYNAGTALLKSSDDFFIRFSDQKLSVDKLLVDKYLKQHNKIQNALIEIRNDNELFNSVIEFVYFVKELFIVLEID